MASPAPPDVAGLRRLEPLEPRLLLSGVEPVAGEIPQPILHSPGTAILDGVDERIVFADRPELNTNEFTIALWFRADDPAATVVEVDLNFLTEEIGPGGSFGASDLLGVTTGSIPDTGADELLFAIAPGDGSYAGTATPLTAAGFSDEFIQDNPYGRYPTIADVSVFNGQTGFRRYSFSLEAGTHTLTFFVADSHTDGGATAMLIDNPTITLV